MHEGTIKTINERGFGFIQTPNQPDVFFHASALADDLEFNEQLQGRRVQFDIVQGPKGPRGSNVEAAK